MIYFLLLLIAVFYFNIYAKSNFGNFRFRNFWFYSFLVVSFLVFLLSMSDPYDLYSVSNEAYFLIALFCVSYLLGFLCANRRKCINYKNIESNLKLSIYELNVNKIFIIINILAAIVMFYFTFKYINNFSILADDSLRTSRFEVGLVFSNTIEILIFNYFVGGFLWFSKFILAYGLIFGTKNIKKIFYINLIICVLSLIFGAGRNIIIEVLLMMIALWNFRLAFCEDVEDFKGFFKKIFFAVFAVLFFVSATYIRMVNEKFSINSFYKALNISIEHVVIYLVGSFRALDYSINYLNLEKGYGVYTFASVNELYNIFLKVLGFDVVPYSNVWGGILAEQINIGLNKDFNALYTAVFNFYFDFGYTGVFLFSFLFGWISSKSVEYFLRKPNIFSLYLICILFMSAFLAFMTFKLTPANILISLVFSFILSKYKFKVN